MTLRQNVVSCKIKGCILGAAVGDAMGAPTETRTMEMIYRDFGGWVKCILPPGGDCFARGRPAGTVTDDFSLGYVTARHIVQSRGQITDSVAKDILLEWAARPEFYLFAGPTTRAAIDALKGMPQDNPNGFLACDNHRATNGGAMKIFAAGLANKGSPDKAVSDTYTLCRPTHPNNVAISAAAAVACAVAKAMEPGAGMDAVIDAGIYGAKQGDLLAREHGLICAQPSVAERIPLAVGIGRAGLGFAGTMRRLSDIIGTGLAAADSVPTVFGILAANPGSVMDAIIMGVNIGNDTDTIATMAGAIAGALHGDAEIPASYLPLIEEVNRMDLQGLARDMQEVFY